MSTAVAAGVMRQSAAITLQAAREYGKSPADALAWAAEMSRKLAAGHLERGNLDLSDAGYDVAAQLDASRARMIARRITSPIPESGIDEVTPPSGVDEYRCDVPGCDFHICAAGPIGDDEEDYFAEEVGEHREWHYDQLARFPLGSQVSGPGGRTGEVTAVRAGHLGIVVCVAVEGDPIRQWWTVDQVEPLVVSA